MNWFQWIQFILGLLPQIIILIQTIEQAIGAGNGAAKKEIVIGSLEAAAAANGANEKQLKSLRAMASALVDRQVAQFNESGTFEKGNK